MRTQPFFPATSELLTAAVMPWRGTVDRGVILLALVFTVPLDLCLLTPLCLLAWPIGRLTRRWAQEPKP